MQVFQMEIHKLISCLKIELVKNIVWSTLLSEKAGHYIILKLMKTELWEQRCEENDEHQLEGEKDKPQHFAIFKELNITSELLEWCSA